MVGWPLEEEDAGPELPAAELPEEPVVAWAGGSAQALVRAQARAHARGRRRSTSDLSASAARLTSPGRGEYAGPVVRHRAFGKIAGPGEALGLVPGGPWVALEKIHGAQMMIAVQGPEIRFGKRKAWLDEDEPFFGWQLVRAGLAERARAAARAIGAPQVVLYGELFGGAYPHPEVPAVPGLQPVQTGVWYAPDLRWAVFDALVAGGDEDEGELLAFRELATVAGGADLMTPPLVRAGPRPQVEATAIRAPTRVPAALGLPPLEDNFAEGLVIRPDARGRPGARPIYKRKIAEFDELRFRESEAWDPARPVTPEALAAWAERLVGPPRIASAASKWGRHDRAALIEEIELDVMIDVSGAFPRAFAALGEAGEAALRAAIRAAAAALLDG